MLIWPGIKGVIIDQNSCKYILVCFHTSLVENNHRGLCCPPAAAALFQTFLPLHQLLHAQSISLRQYWLHKVSLIAIKTLEKSFCRVHDLKTDRGKSDPGISSGTGLTLILLLPFHCCSLQSLLSSDFQSGELLEKELLLLIFSLLGFVSHNLNSLFRSSSS